MTIESKDDFRTRKQPMLLQTHAQKTIASSQTAIVRSLGINNDKKHYLETEFMLFFAIVSRDEAKRVLVKGEALRHLLHF
jgi:hypothetical protein